MPKKFPEKKIEDLEVDETAIVKVTFEILHIETEEKENTYRHGWDNGRTFYQPMFYCIKYQGLIDGITAYFTHSLNFVNSTGLVNGKSFDDMNKKDFATTEEIGESKVHKSSTPEIFPKAIALEIPKTQVNVLHKIGDKIKIKARCTLKISAVGRKYYKLSHVTLIK